MARLRSISGPSSETPPRIAQEPANAGGAVTKKKSVGRIGISPILSNTGRIKILSELGLITDSGGSAHPKGNSYSKRCLMIYIVGCNHRLQRTDIQGIWEEVTDPAGREEDERERRAFAERLEQIIEEHHITRIAEESDPSRRRIGRVLAEKHNCCYQVITMLPERRRHHGIPENYEETAATREHAYRLFEQHFFGEVQSIRREGENVLMIVGSLHREPVANCFRQVGPETVLTEQIGPAND